MGIQKVPSGVSFIELITDVTGPIDFPSFKKLMSSPFFILEGVPHTLFFFLVAALRNCAIVCFSKGLVIHHTVSFFFIKSVLLFFEYVRVMCCGL
jgi:hypothetical protein